MVLVVLVVVGGGWWVVLVSGTLESLTDQQVGRAVRCASSTISGIQRIQHDIIKHAVTTVWGGGALLSIMQIHIGPKEKSITLMDQIILFVKGPYTIIQELDGHHIYIYLYIYRDLLCVSS